MRMILSAALAAMLALPAWADARITVLLDALRMTEVLEIMRTEGLAYADDLDRDMLGGQGGDFWDAQVTRIYDIGRMRETVRRGLEAGLQDEALDAALAFMNTERGDRIIALENAARAAIADDAVEEAARAEHEALRDAPDALLALIDRFVAVNGLVDRNVAGAMSSNYQFFRGLSDGRMLNMSESEMLADVWGQEADIREDTEGWIYAYLILAYRPLPLEDLEAYVAFSETAAGRALNAALFDGQEEMFRDISYALGRAVALSAAGSTL